MRVSSCEHPEADRVLAGDRLLVRIDADVEVVEEQIVVGAVAPVLAAQDVGARRRPLGGRLGGRGPLRIGDRRRGGLRQQRGSEREDEEELVYRVSEHDAPQEQIRWTLPRYATVNPRATILQRRTHGVSAVRLSTPGPARFPKDDGRSVDLLRGCPLLGPGLLSTAPSPGSNRVASSKRSRRKTGAIRTSSRRSARKRCARGSCVTADPRRLDSARQLDSNRPDVDTPASMKETPVKATGMRSLAAVLAFLGVASYHHGCRSGTFRSRVGSPWSLRRRPGDSSWDAGRRRPKVAADEVRRRLCWGRMTRWRFPPHRRGST